MSHFKASVGLAVSNLIKPSTTSRSSALSSGKCAFPDSLVSLEAQVGGRGDSILPSDEPSVCPSGGGVMCKGLVLYSRSSLSVLLRLNGLLNVLRMLARNGAFWSRRLVRYLFSRRSSSMAGSFCRGPMSTVVVLLPSFRLLLLPRGLVESRGGLAWLGLAFGLRPRRSLTFFKLPSTKSRMMVDCGIMGMVCD